MDESYEIAKKKKKIAKHKSFPTKLSFANTNFFWKNFRIRKT